MGSPKRLVLGCAAYFTTVCKLPYISAQLYRILFQPVPESTFIGVSRVREFVDLCCIFCRLTNKILQVMCSLHIVVVDFTDRNEKASREFLFGFRRLVLLKLTTNR